ncbi:hypothetical protein HJ01_03588 [Flavobacterium frigoris PS1]|uniref:Uncharacterized protein n=1 Tax=Flavobacterium frigoris (strain PS1) TaxID=1086011 RepID=H7FWL3_FLAFP|nr:hypothetical protein HJ01_03588 [Flavobacterium frigoris PS1]
MDFIFLTFILIPFSNIIYKIGKINNVRNVATINPPITTVANGFCTSAPEPLLSAIGKKPNDATSAVINTGRKRTLVPCRTIDFKLVSPVFFIRLNSAIKTNPFKTAIPNKAIKPTPALILKGIPRIARKNIPPIIDNGIAE